MKITKTQLKEIIREEINSILNEAGEKLLGSSPTLDGIIKGISKYYYGSTIKLDKISDNPEVYSVSNKKGIISSVRVVKKGNRYRFEKI